MRKVTAQPIYFPAPPFFVDNNLWLGYCGDTFTARPHRPFRLLREGPQHPKNMHFLDRIRLHFRPGIALGRLHVTPLAQAIITRRDLFAALALHKEGPWDGFGQRWHDCSGNYPVWCEDEAWEGRALYSGAYSQAGPMMLVRTAPDGQSTTVLLAEEEGCDNGWRRCEVCQDNLIRYRELVFAALADDSIE